MKWKIPWKLYACEVVLTFGGISLHREDAGGGGGCALDRLWRVACRASMINVIHSCCLKCLKYCRI